MRLEDLVPPQELCKQIPKGAFADSALMWYRGIFTGVYLCIPREEAYKKLHTIPAPTLQEIMAELANNGMDAPAVGYDGETWTVFFIRHHYEDHKEPEEDDNPATAALKLWLELKRIEP